MSDEEGYDEEFENQNYDDEFGEIDRELNAQQHHHNNNQEEEDDEQKAQKFNGKIDSLQQRVEELEGELSQERELGLEMRQQYEKELQSAWKEQTKQEEINSSNIKNETVFQNEINKYKTRCDLLQEQLDIALLTGKSTTKDTAGGIPEELQTLFHKVCTRLNIFPEYAPKTKKLTTEDCVEILQTSLSHQMQLQKQVTHYKELQDSKLEGEKEEKEAEDDENGDQVSLDSEGNPATKKSKALSTKKLRKKFKSLEEDFKLAGEDSFIGSVTEGSTNGGGKMSGGGGGTNYLKNRIFQLSERIRIEKEHKRGFEQEVIIYKRKIEMLSDHIEKIMLHLKREGAQKLRFAEQVRILEKELLKIKEKAEIIQRKSSAKDRLIVELREGSKILEDQLRLMDEKFLELRSKLDYARMISYKKIKKAEKLASDLRVKFIMMNGGGTSGNNTMLDSVQPPGMNTMNGYGEYDSCSVNYDDPWGTAGEDQHSPMTMNTVGIAGKRSKVRMNLPQSQQQQQQQYDNHSVLTDNNSISSKRSTVSMDSVQEKIRLQMGGKQEWTEEKARKLVAFTR